MGMPTVNIFMGSYESCHVDIDLENTCKRSYEKFMCSFIYEINLENIPMGSHKDFHDEINVGDGRT